MTDSFSKAYCYYTYLDFVGDEKITGYDLNERRCITE